MVEKQQFEVGDLVKLRSGSPTMTVVDETMGGDYRCKWFSGSKSNHDVFPPEALERADSEEG